MRVLIVDAFCPSPAGRENLAEFRCAITKSFESILLTDLAIAVRDKSKLHDFVYDSTTEFAQITALRSFQALDMVFVGSDDTCVLPWCKSVHMLRILIKQCIRMHKPTFCTAFAMQMLVTVCLLEGENIKIFNGRGRGSSIHGGEELPQPRILKHLKNDVENSLAESEEYFLDAGTGDLYQQQDHEWAFYKNAGLYNPIFAPRKCASVHGSYRSKTQMWEDAKPVRIDEMQCELTHARFLQHWILKDVAKQFVIPTRTSWRVVGVLPQYFDVLLAGKTPILITIGPICGFQSLVTRKYPETVKVISNWIDHVTRAVLSDVPYALGFCPEILSCATSAKCALSPEIIKRHRKLQSLANPEPAEPEKNERSRAPADDGSAPEEVLGTSAGWDTITKAFSEDAPKVTFQHFTHNEIRRFLHPSVDIEAVKVKKVVYIGNRPASQKQKQRKEPVAKPFVFAGRASTCNGLPGQIPNFVSVTPGQFPCDHTFRTTNKKKWFNQRGFVPASGGWKEFPIAKDAATNKTTNHIPFRNNDPASRKRPITCPAGMGRSPRGASTAR